MTVQTETTPVTGAPLGVAWLIIVGSIALLWLIGGFTFRSITS